MALARKLLLYQVTSKADRISRAFRNPTVILRQSEENAAAFISFNRPRFFNCIDDSVINPLAAFLSSCSTNNNVKLLIFSSINTNSKNPTFGTGADLIKGWRIIDRYFKTGLINTEDRIYLINFYRTQHLLHKMSG